MRPRRRAEEAQLPPLGKRESAAQVERACLNTLTKIMNIRVLEILISFCPLFILTITAHTSHSPKNDLIYSSSVSCLR